METTTLTPNARNDHAVDVGRLRRAIERDVKQIGPSRYLVEGRSEPHYLVDLEAPIACTCEDAQRHGAPCLHEMAARLRTGDARLLAGVKLIVTNAEREIRTLRVRMRRSVERRAP